MKSRPRNNSKRPWWSIPPSPPPKGTPPDVLWLSPTEEAILYACSEEQFRSAREIRKAAELSKNWRFPHLLPNLAARNILETDTEGRYRIRTRKKAKSRKPA